MTSTAVLTISVIVPVHQRGEKFQRCVNSLTQAAPPPREIIIVADGEADGDWKPQETLGLQVLRLPVAEGPARARNYGAHAATGDVLLFIDSDVTVRTDIIGKIAAIFAGEPDLTAVIGSYDDEPAAENFFSQYKNLLHHYVHQNARDEGFTFWGACGAVRREIFFALDGFDESYRKPSIEDIEFGYRLRKAGHKIRLVKELQVTHLKRWEALSLLTSDFLHRALPWTELTWRARYLPDDLNLRRSSRLSALLACALVTSLLAGVWNSKAFAGATLLVLLLLSLNASLYRFFFRKRGAKFTLSAILWHWFYLLYSALAFGIGTLRFFVNSYVSRAFNSTKAISKAGKS